MPNFHPHFCLENITSHAAKAFSFSMIVVFSNCSSPKERAVNYTSYVDTTVSVYGSYKAIKLPITKGVQIANPIQIALGPDQILYGSNATGEVYSLRDSDRDGLEDMAVRFCDVKDFGLRSPSGFAHRGDTIYVGTAQQIRAFLDRDKDGKADSSWTFFDDIPNSGHPYEWTCGLNFGQDGWLYAAFSTDSWNASPSPDPNGFRGSIIRISPNGKRTERIATGIRSVYDMTFDPNGDLLFVDNEGGGNAKEELNRLVKNGFYGHNPKKYSFDSIIEPDYALKTEMAPSGLEFNPVDNNFGGTGGNLFITYYGPGERWTRGSIGRVVIKQNADGSYSYEEIPVADIPKLSNLAFGKDGSLYVAQHGKADYWYNAVYKNEGCFYKLVHDPSVSAKSLEKRNALAVSFSKNSVEAGKLLFAEHACLACHAVDGDTELLGPNLKDVGKRLSREEILEEIVNPSQRIKPSMNGQRIVTRDGKVFLGRVVNANENQLSVMLVGNNVIEIPRSEIKSTEDEKKSLMYEDLLSGLSVEERESLLDYIVSLSN